MHNSDHHNKPEVLEQQLTEINQALEKDTVNTKLLLEKSSCLRYLNRYEEALLVHDLLISMNKDNLDYLFMKGLVLIECSKEEQAIQCFNEILEKDPTHRDSLFNLGLALKRLGRDKEAREFVKKAMKI